MLKILKKISSIPAGGKSAIAYTLSTILSRGLAIITIPIFTRIMTTNEIGTVNLYNSWYGLISMIATLSLTSGGFVIALKEFADSRDQYQSSVLTLTSLVAVIISIVYFIAPSYWENVIGLPKELLILMLIGFLFAPARDFWLARQRYEYKYKLPFLITVLSAFAASIASIIIVLYLNNIGSKHVAEGRLISNYIIIYGVCAVLWIYLFVKGHTFYNKKYWLFSLNLSIPLIGYSIASQVLNVSDRMMISKISGNAAVGIYGTLYSVSSISIMIWSALHSSFVPYLFQNIEKKNNNIKKISSSLLFLYALIAILMTLFAPEIVRILATNEYYEAIFIMPPIAAGVFFTSYANIYSDIAIYYKKTKYVMYPTLVAAIANIILNYIFINIFGYQAAAYTTLISYILLSVLQAFWARKLCKRNGIGISIYDDKKLAVLAIVTTCCCLFGEILYKNTLARYIAIVICFVILIVVGYLYKMKKYK